MRDLLKDSDVALLPLSGTMIDPDTMTEQDMSGEGKIKIEVVDQHSLLKLYKIDN